MTAQSFAHLRARAFNTPLMVEPNYAAHFFAYFGSRTGAQQLITASGETVDNLPAFAESYQVRTGRRNAEGRYEPYAIDGRGLATISVEGTLVHKLGLLDPYSGMQGYDGLIAKLQSASNDARVRAVLLDVHSPGGEVSGVYDAARAIRAFNKPIAAVADDQMTSAAYLLASQADLIYASPTASVGSIGVVTAHYDFSDALAAEGVKVTLIAAGEHKVDGNPYEALPPEVYTEVKARLESSRRDFAKAVAANRPMSVDDLLATEARIYEGATARRMGLVDHVMLPSGVAEHFARRINTAGNSSPTINTTKGKAMSESENQTANADTVTRVEYTQAVEAARAEGQASGQAEGRKAERERIGAILSSEHAQGRMAFAQTLATTTELEAEAAINLLQAAPAEAPASADATVAGTPALEALKQGAKVEQPASDQASKPAGGEKRLEAAAERLGIALVK